jgi:invasion protein IalB
MIRFKRLSRVGRTTRLGGPLLSAPLVAALLMAGPLLAAPAVAEVSVATAYILYHHTFGDWSVVCWRGLVGPERSCFIDAPPISVDEEGRRSSVRIAAAGKAGLTVTVSSRSGTVLGTPVVLRVDDNPAHERRPDALDHATWGGAEAARIVEELHTGRRLLLRFPAARTVAGEVTISLEGFAAALTAFRDRLSELDGGRAGSSAN